MPKHLLVILIQSFIKDKNALRSQIKGSSRYNQIRASEGLILTRLLRCSNVYFKDGYRNNVQILWYFNVGQSRSADHRTSDQCPSVSRLRESDR